MANEKVCGHDEVERYCVICLNDELDRSYRTINGIEDVLKRNGVAITYPLSDAVEDLIEVLEFYADEKTYDVSGPLEGGAWGSAPRYILTDGGQKAREALGKED